MTDYESVMMKSKGILGSRTEFDDDFFPFLGIFGVGIRSVGSVLEDTATKYPHRLGLSSGYVRVNLKKLISSEEQAR